MLCIQLCQQIMTNNLLVELDEIKSYIVPVFNTNDFNLNPNIIVLKTELGEMQKHSRPFIICFHQVFKLRSPEEHYTRLLSLYIPWRNKNELKQDNQSYENRYKEVEGDILCNVKEHEPYLDIDYEELQQNVNFS